MEGSFGPLDLSDADIKGFAALDPGSYAAEIFAITMDAVKNTDGQGKLPAGTPMMKVQFKVLEPRMDGEVIEQDRRAFTQYVIPPNDYDPKKRATMRGMLARFFIATGDEETDVMSSSFAPDFDDYIGKEVVIVLSKEVKYGTDLENTAPEDIEYDNRVKGVKKAGSAVGTSASSLL